MPRASSSNPAEDLIIPLGGPVPVSRFYADGMVSAAMNEHIIIQHLTGNPDSVSASQLWGAHFGHVS